MTREEKIEYLAKAVMRLGELGDNKIAYALNEIRLELKSQLELPEALEDAAEHLASDITPIYPDIFFAARYERIKKSFIAGAKWDRAKMMKRAMECDVIVPIYEGNNVWSTEIKIHGRYEPGDKIKVIIIPEEK